jgi:N-acetylglucosamine malate deacetylase 1
MNQLLPGPVLVVAPHPDDEVLGCGGTIARLTDAGIPTHVGIVTRGKPPQFDPAQARGVAEEALAAHSLLHVTQTHWLDLPAAALDQVPHGELNAAIGALVARVRPATILIPFAGDIHLDHQLVFRSCLVAARPRSPDAPALVMAYETLSETNWGAPTVDPGFAPTCFIDISATLDRKLEAFAAFHSQVRAFPDERSLETIRALALLRGSTVYRPAAEAFHVIRDIR